MVVVVAPLEIKEKIVTGAGELGCPLMIYMCVRISAVAVRRADERRDAES